MKRTCLVPLILELFWATLACGARSDLYCSRGTCSGPGDAREEEPPSSDPYGSAGRGGLDPPPRANPVLPRPDPEKPPPPDPVEPPELEFRCRGGVGFGPIAITSIEELRVLEGCERIEGDLQIWGFAAPHLAPLASLREVTGDLRLGTQGSLVGLSSLERLGSLTLEGATASSLEPLENLRTIGRLLIQNSPNLQDLRGLGSVRLEGVVEIVGNAGLSSLSGLNLPGTMARVLIASNPVLSDITALSSLREVDQLHLIGNGLADVGALSGLRAATEIVIAESPVTDVSSLGNLVDVELLRLSGLPLANLDGLERLPRAGILRLADLPELEQVDAIALLPLSAELSISGTRRLERLPSFPAVTTLDRLVLERNSALASGPDLPNLIRIDRLSVIQNPELRDLTGLRTLGQARNIEIHHNQELASVDLSSLTSFRSLRVSCNPLLPEAVLAPLAASERGVVITAGNLGSAEPCPP